MMNQAIWIDTRYVKDLKNTRLRRRMFWKDQLDGYKNYDPLIHLIYFQRSLRKKKKKTIY